MITLSRFARIVTVVVTMTSATSVLAGAYEDILAAVRDDHNDVVANLIQRGMDVNTSDPSGTTLLMVAAGNGNIELVEFLLRSGANILIQNQYGDTAVAIAALRGKFAVVRRLVDAGAAIDGSGWTPLHYAAYSGHADIAQYLIDKHAPLDSRAPNGQTALMLAARNGHLEVVKLLASANADLQLSDSTGNTASDLALKAGNTDIADYLRRKIPHE